MLVGRLTIKRQFKKSFSGKGVKAIWKGKIKLKWVSKEEDIKKDDHVIRFTDPGEVDLFDSDPAILGAAPPGENVIRLSSKIIDTKVSKEEPNESRARDENGWPTLEAISAHELGHSLGLFHPNDSRSRIKRRSPRSKFWRGNLMQRGDSPYGGAKINELQVYSIYLSFTSGQLNKGLQF